MKKTLVAVAIICSITSFAQSTSPRFGTTPGKDNTFRTLTNKYAAYTDAAGLDSVAVTPSAFRTIYKVTLVDSFCFKQPTITTSYLGDEMTIILTAASGTPIFKFSGSNWVTASSGRATLSTGLRGVINLVFDGGKWVEKGRVIQ